MSSEGARPAQALTGSSVQLARDPLAVRGHQAPRSELRAKATGSGAQPAPARGSIMGHCSGSVWIRRCRSKCASVPSSDARGNANTLTAHILSTLIIVKVICSDACSRYEGPSCAISVAQSINTRRTADSCSAGECLWRTLAAHYSCSLMPAPIPQTCATI